MNCLYSGSLVSLFKEDCVFVVKLHAGENRFNPEMLQQMTECLDIVESYVKRNTNNY